MLRSHHHQFFCTSALVLVGAVMLGGCIEHRVAVSPPLPAAPAPAGEPAAITQLISGSKVIDEPNQPTTASSPLPIDLPVSVWRRDSDGLLSRGEMRVTTALPWWQRFPVDAFVDLSPFDAEVFASGTATLTPVPKVDRARLFDQAAHDGYAHTVTAPKASKIPAGESAEKVTTKP
jgi:hypothetical protein